MKREQAKKMREATHKYFERRREEDKEIRKRKGERIKSLYDKPKEVKFKTKETVNMTKHFKLNILNNRRANWPLSARAVYPVLCSRADFENYEKWFYLSRENIATLAGISKNTVDKGLDYLTSNKSDGEYIAEKEVHHTKDRKTLRLRVRFVRGEEAEKFGYFVFYTSIIDTGIWAILSPRAKAFYLALRDDAYFDMTLFLEVMEAEGKEVPKIVKNTKDCPHGYGFGIDIDKEKACDTCKIWDHCMDVKEGTTDGKMEEIDADKWLVNPLPIAEICKKSGISPSHMGDVLEELEGVGLVENYDDIRIIYLKNQGNFDINDVHNLNLHEA